MYGLSLRFGSHVTSLEESNAEASQLWPTVVLLYILVANLLRCLGLRARRQPMLPSWLVPKH
jgi:hypothetical protein